MKTKKAIVMSETLKMIIAALCIFLLIYLAVGLYGIFTRSSELEQAKATLDGIMGKAGALQNGQSVEYLVTSPKGWSIIILPEEKLNLCICPEGTASCLKQGACVMTNKKVYFYQKNIDYLQKAYNCIKFSELPFIITIKNEDGIIILSDKNVESIVGKVSFEDLLNFRTKVFISYGKYEEKSLREFFDFAVNSQAGLFTGGHFEKAINSYFSSKYVSPPLFIPKWKMDYSCDASNIRSGSFSNLGATNSLKESKLVDLGRMVISSNDTTCEFNLKFEEQIETCN
jgi:hypothetical protein